MNTTEFVFKQLALPESNRVIPDRIYMWDTRAYSLETLIAGYGPYNASSVFTAAVYYEKADYFRPGVAGESRYYLNGVF